jgi:uncharacterized damage-inducible protein DinB
VANVPAIIHELRARRAATRNALDGLADEQLTTRVGERGDVRTLLLRIDTLMRRRRVDLARTLDALGWRQSEAQQILALAMEARGELHAALLGLPDEEVDREPAPGEWSVRQTMQHQYAVDERYTQGIEYAVQRLRSKEELPMQRPEGGMPARVGDVHLEGSLDGILGQLDDLRDDVIQRLAGITEAELAAPMVYQGREVEVRYRLHLVAAHEREHTGQIVRAIRDLDLQHTEVEMILALAEAARGAVEGVLVGLPAELLERAPSGLPSVHQILETAIREEGELVDAVVGATV